MKSFFNAMVWTLVCLSLCTANGSAISQVPPKAPKTQVVIIGTIHSKHYENPAYSPDVLREIILSLKPDAILNELPLSLVEPNGRPVENIRKKDRWGPETWASDTVATQLGIRQIPFDRPDRNEHDEKTNYSEREKKSNELANKLEQQIQKEDPDSVDLKIGSLAGYAYKARDEMIMSFGPKELNSEPFDLIIRIKTSIVEDIAETIYRKYPGYDGLADDCKFFRNEWLERNKIMAENIKKTAKEYPGKRLVVITGAEHRYILRDLLKDVNSIDLKEYWEIKPEPVWRRFFKPFRNYLETPPEVDKPHEINEPVLTKEQRIFGLVTIYRAAKQHFAYFGRVPNLDWDKSFMDFLPQVEKEQSLFEYYRTLQRFTALLQDGHTQVYLPSQLERQMDNLPITLDYVEDQWVVTERRPTDEIIKEDIPPGTVIVSLDGINTSEYFEKNVFPYTASGTIQGKRSEVNWSNFLPKDKEIEIKLCYPDGNTSIRSIKANRKSVKWTPKLSAKYMSDLRGGDDFLVKQLDKNVLYVRYRECNDKCRDEFSKLIESLHPTPPSAMIIDLRGNSGGNTPTDSVKHLISRPIARYFFKTPCSISYIEAQIQSARNRGLSEQEVIDTVIKPRSSLLPKNYIPGWFIITSSDINSSYIEPAEKHYDGPLVILTNAETASAAEDFAVLLHGSKRAKIVGEPSYGSTGQPIFYELPGGGKVRICTAVCQYPDGRDFVGVGIQPDIPVKRTIKGIAEGRDEILEAALDYVCAVDKTEKSL